tara:strand:+ start:5055 stop:5732 length:678 start_codon:yes stop_codon:yes gene_type:complete
MKNISLIPARKNSKGVTKKNKRLLGGIPLFAHSVNFSTQSKLIDKTVINSDDEDILNYCKTNYKKVDLFRRSKNLAEDSTPMIDVLCDYLSNIDNNPEFITLLQPTSPLRSQEDLNSMYKIINENPNIDCITSIQEVPQHLSPYLMFHLNDDIMDPLFKEVPTRRQEVKTTFIRDGQIYIFRISSLLKNKKIITNQTYGYVSSIKGINIDSEEDWSNAVKLFEDS